MRIVWVAALTFAAGLLVGSTLLGGAPVPPPLAADPTPLGAAAGGGERGPGGAGLPGPPVPAASEEPGADAPGLETARQPSPFHPRARRAWVLELLDQAYAERRQQKETSLPADLRPGASGSALTYLERMAKNYGAFIADYVDRRRAYGVLGDPPRITLQARGSGNVTTTQSQGAVSAWLRPVPLDLDAPLTEGEALTAHVACGVVPVDRVLLIERLEVVLYLGTNVDAPSQPWRREGSVRIVVGGAASYAREGAGGAHAGGTLRGLAIVRPPHEQPRIDLSLRRGVAGVVAHGRLVSPAEAEGLTAQRFAWAEEGDDGLLGEEAVLLQVVADHGGGNPRTVRLDGSTDRIGSLEDHDLWDEDLDLRGLRGSHGRTENTGLVPAGKLYRVTTIDWRARLDPQQTSHSAFALRFQGKDLVRRAATDGVAFSGRWEGEVDLAPGDEDRFEIVCAYFAMGEAVITGSLIDAK